MRLMIRGVCKRNPPKFYQTSRFCTQRHSILFPPRKACQAPLTALISHFLKSNHVFSPKVSPFLTSSPPQSPGTKFFFLSFLLTTVLPAGHSATSPHARESASAWPSSPGEWSGCTCQTRQRRSSGWSRVRRIGRRWRR